MLIVRALDQLVRLCLQQLQRRTSWTPKTGSHAGAEKSGPLSSALRDLWLLLLPHPNAALSKHPFVLLALTVYYAGSLRVGGILRKYRPQGLRSGLSELLYELRPYLGLVAPFAKALTVLCLACAIIVYVQLASNLIPFAKVLFGWLSLGAFIYLLISGFVYFTNKLSYSANVDVIQRFWKRTFSVFWLIEAGLFAFFVYMVLNASSEVWAGYDTPSLFKTQFFSLKMLFVRLSLLSFAILFASLLVNLAAHQDSSGEAMLQVLVTCLLVFSLWIEAYQFYLFAICAPTYAWVFNAEAHEAFVDSDMRRNRLVRNFVFVCALAKFWHFLFIAVNWLFYLNRQLEHSEVRLGLLNSTIQNLLILYILNLIAMLPYVKHLTHKGLAKSYFWFLADEGASLLPKILSFTWLLYSNAL